MQESNNAEDCRILYEQNNSSDSTFYYPWRTAMHEELKAIAHNYTNFVKFWPIVLATKSKIFMLSSTCYRSFRNFWGLKHWRYSDELAWNSGLRLVSVWSESITETLKLGSSVLSVKLSGT
jgi:hypothetical protein